jgi:exodeoxyribonuclease-3
LKIATYNINGVRGRLANLVEWLEEAEPDVVCLQELKCPDGQFPVRTLNEAGYGAIWHGQSSYNGVAILARDYEPIEIRRGLPDDPDERQSRYIEAAVKGVLIANLYLPNGNPLGSPKFAYKLAWFETLMARSAELFGQPAPVVIAGDYNVIPTDFDCKTPRQWRDNALFSKEAKAAYARMLEQGWTDALRALHPDEAAYTFWKYWPGAFERDDGMRIDHLLLNPQAAEALTAAEVDREVRGREHSSDHAPVWIELEL